MRQDLTEMVFILDRSGSMEHLVADTIGGFNSLIEDQKSKEGDAFVTTVLFDGAYEMLHDHVDIKKIQPITSNEYFARGTTALLDAIGRTINSIGARLNNTLEEERPSRVIFTIITDGEENSSIEFNKNKIKEMIEHQQNVYSWTFMFLGANIDAIQEANSLGIRASHSHGYTASSVGTTSVYNAISSATTSLRSEDYATATVDALDCIITSALCNVQ